MENEAKKHLFDLVEACKRIEEFTNSKTLDQYRTDPLLRSAVERQFQIAGEALQKLLKRFPEVANQITDYRSIINFRNILVHGYDHVVDDVVWGVVQSNLPLLRKETEKLLNSN